MTDQKAIGAFQLCARLVLREHPRAVPSRAVSTETAPRLGPGGRANHLLYMCEAGADYVRAGRREKAMRWLGFVQGAIWTTYGYSIDVLKNMNRPEEP